MAESKFSIDQLIINSPYEEPSSYWAYHRKTRFFTRNKGRRPAGYVTATPGSKSFDDPGILRELPLVNQIRPRVKAWREANYAGVTGITRRMGKGRIYSGSDLAKVKAGMHACPPAGTHGAFSPPGQRGLEAFAAGAGTAGGG